MKIKSSIHNYTVEYDSIDNIKIEEGDFIICDNNLSNKVDTILDSQKHSYVVVPGLESFKEYKAIGNIIDTIIECGFRKNNRLIAIGGGVVQDITGFIASILYRGVEWHFYPTTLLSQGDSCIGGKTSINFGEYKNQIGNFYPPHKIIIDTNFLRTLPNSQILSGLGEMAHYFLIDGNESFNLYREELNDLNVNRKRGLIPKLSFLIKKSLEIKKRMIELDEFDEGPRRVFNYGHSFGHVIESMSEYKIPHGIAVAMGMDIANYISDRMGLISEEKYLEIRETLLPIYKGFMRDFNNVDFELFIDTLKKDKKNKGDELGLILTKGIGEMFLDYYEPNEIKLLLVDYYYKQYENTI